MNQRLHRRVTDLERQHHAAMAPTFLEVHAAAQRLRRYAVALLRSRLHGEPLPIRDEAQAEADQSMVSKWCRAEGTYVDPTGAHDQFQAHLRAIAARHAAAAALAVQA